jgi:protein phosphatase
MTGQDWLLFSALLVVVGTVAYALGARRRESDPARAAAPPRAPAPAPGPVARAADEDEEASVAPAETAPAKAPEAETAPAATEKPAEEPAEKPAEKSAAKKDEEEEKPLPTIPKLSDPEEDDDVDVTRVGSMAVPPPRLVIQAPVMLIGGDDVAPEEPSNEEPYFLISATAQTDAGLRRKQNEDSLLVNREHNLFVVADGMGGHNAGEQASRLAVTAIDEAFTTGTFEGKPHEDIPLEASELARAMQMANATILEHAKTSKELEGMGTTLCCARFSPTKRRLHIGHVGDSRCYRFRDGVFTQLTKDHTMADLGLKGPEAANLSRAVGIWSTVPIDMIVAAPSPDDVYLLCSDGLTKMLDDDRIAHVLRSEEDAKAAVDRLIFFANAKGGKDNITVILIRVVAPSAAQ